MIIPDMRAGGGAGGHYPCHARVKAPGHWDNLLTIFQAEFNNSA
jgi:hypothetical protein